jgi:hypothetical protein
MTAHADAATIRAGINTHAEDQAKNRFLQAIQIRESLDKWGLSGGTKQNEWFWPQIASEAIF